MANPPPEPSLTQKIHMTDSYHKFVHNTSMAMLFVAPLLIALPPRKLDIYTFTLGGIFVVSGNQLLRERNGTGILGLLPGKGAEAGFKALALGADFCWIGRPVLWGLAYKGQAGVELCLKLVSEEVKGVMGLAGVESTKEITREYLVKMDRSGFVSRL
jgi:hypothetical protein